jgi:hypothetical protein
LPARRGRHTNRKQLDLDAAIAELQEIAGGRTDLLAKRAGLILAFHDEDARWIAVGQEPAQRIPLGGAT